MVKQSYLPSTSGFNFLSDFYSRKVIRIVTLLGYFILFQSLILFQKPFLQFDFIVVFYLAFGALFAHHLFFLLNGQSEKKKSGFASYAFDFVILILFMKPFPYLSSFILVLQLFLLFISSFDLVFIELAILGFIASLGASVINFTSTAAGSTQGVLVLALFNLSYLSVIIISRQLRSEYFVIQKDLTQTKKKWKSQAEFSNSLIEKLPFGLVVFDKSNEIILQNSYLKNNLKLSLQQMQNLISSYRERPQSSTLDIPFLLNLNEQKILNIDQTQYFDEEINENLALYLIKDVTELRILENQLKQSEKLAAVGTLAAGIAHEIRNPLAGISGSIQMLSQDSADLTQKKLMNIVLREIDRLNLLITEFLDYAKPEKSPDQRINLAQILEEVVLSTQRHPEVSENFKWVLELSPAEIFGFSEKLKQAFLNIIINAVQAMKNSQEPSLEIKLSAHDGQALLVIKDNGSGMSEENLSKMFEPFHTTKPKGTGLGLAITHKILENHKAQIEVKSTLNVGTEFKIKIPLTKNAGEQK